MPDAEEEDDEDMEDEDDEQQPGEGADGQGKGKGNKKKNGEGGSWWPRESFVVKKETELEILVETDRAKLQEQYNLLVKDTQALLTL